jgi:hypothetical protein
MLNKIKLCECGCEKYAKPGNRFIHGHNRQGKFHTKSTKEKMSRTMRIVDNTPEIRDKNSRSKIDYYQNPLNREKHVVRCNTFEARRNNSIAHNLPEVVAKLSQKARVAWCKPGMREKYKQLAIIASNKPERKAKHSEFMNKCWKDPEFIKKQMKARNVAQNQQEKKLENILNELYPNEYKFVGDGEVIISGKCPDFININGKKKIIELFGDYWHEGENPQDRMDIFKPYGYETLVIWERELKDAEKIRDRISEFHKIE